ncbi:unnamed protein product [Closterium sp. NIES-65]|nr:unnamed protein product [Closterium sp. NIES-65]
MPTSAGLRTPSPDARAPAAAEAKSLMGESGAVGRKGRKRGAEWRRGETCQGAPHRRLAYSASNHRPIAATSLHLPAVLLSPRCPSLSPLSFSLPAVLLSPRCPSLSPLSFSLPAVLLSPRCPSLSPLSFSLPAVLLSPRCPSLSPLSFSLPAVLLSPRCPSLSPLSFSLPAVLLSPRCPSLSPLSFSLPAVLLSPRCPSLSPLSFSLPAVLLSPRCPSLSPLSFSLPAVLLSPRCPSLSPLSSLPPVLLSPHCPPLSPLSFSLPPVLLSTPCPPLSPLSSSHSVFRSRFLPPSPMCIPLPSLQSSPSWQRPLLGHARAHETEVTERSGALDECAAGGEKAALHFEAPSIPTFSVLHLSSPVPLLPCPHNGPIVHPSMAHMLALLHVPFPPSSPSAAKGNAEEGEVEGEGVRK